MIDITYNSYNRELIKKIELLPNVSKLTIYKTGLDERALILGLEKVTRKMVFKRFEEGQAPNEYLERQFKRLAIYAIEGETGKFNFLSEMMIQKSITYRLLAFNRVLPGWYGDYSWPAIKKHWRELSAICKSQTGKVNYKRVWIEKKPGDFARPLGVPTVAWRANSYMRLNMLEIRLKALNFFETWQHGGRSGVGVATAWSQLVENLNKRFIFEFDLKGFFDHVDHKAILKVLEDKVSPEMTKWIKETLESKPQSYTLPEEDKDTALIKYNELVKEMNSYESKIEYLPWKEMTEEEAIKNYENYLNDWEFVDAMEQEEYAEDVENSMKIVDNIQTLRSNYKILMEGKDPRMENFIPFTRFITKAPELEDRQIGRDNWKNLGIEGKGVPQGLGTSPFLSTMLTHEYLREIKDVLLMYVDDGLLMSNNREELLEKLELFKIRCKEFGVEISPKKSGWVRDDQWIKNLKFCGLEYDHEVDNIRAATRNGTTEWFRPKDLKTLLAIKKYWTGNSGQKRLITDAINLKSWELASKHGMLGALIAECQSPVDKETMKRLGYEGTAQSIMRKLTKVTSFIWKFQDLWPVELYDEENKLRLKSLSSIACIKFLKFIKHQERTRSRYSKC